MAFVPCFDVVDPCHVHKCIYCLYTVVLRNKQFPTAIAEWFYSAFWSTVGPPPTQLFSTKVSNAAVGRQVMKCHGELEPWPRIFGRSHRSCGSETYWNFLGIDGIEFEGQLQQKLSGMGRRFGFGVPMINPNHDLLLFLFPCLKGQVSSADLVTRPSFRPLLASPDPPTWKGAEARQPQRRMD